MDPLMMFGAWAAAIMSVAGAGRLVFKAFIKATRAAVSEEFKRVWKELDESDRWHEERFAKFERALDDLRQQIARLETMMKQYVREQ
jgi:membrane protein involved in colicin uptake